MFDLQLFAYQTTDLVTVGQVKAMGTRIAARLTALESKKAIRTVVVDNNAKTMKFYSVPASDITSSTVPETTFNYPEELYLSQTGTTIVENFVFSAATYPGATDPNLDGKTVLILAVRGDNSTVVYSFVNMSSIYSDFMPKDTTASAGNLAEWQSDGTVTDSSIAGAGVLTTISGSTANNVMMFDSNGKVADSGHGIATDAEFNEMLDEVLPVT